MTNTATLTKPEAEIEYADEVCLLVDYMGARRPFHASGTSADHIRSRQAVERMGRNRLAMNAASMRAARR